MEARNLPKIDGPIDVEITDDKRNTFAESAMALIESHLESNWETAAQLSYQDENVEDVLDYGNIDHLQIRSRPFENPRMTLWLKDCPTWANDAWTETFHPFGFNSYNGKVQATFDVRPF